MNTLTLAQQIRRTAFRDLTKALLILLVATNLVTGYHYAKVALDDPRDYAQYNSSYGPFALKDGMTTGLEAHTYGPLQSVYHAGDAVAFSTSLCLAPTTTIIGHAQLVRVAQNGVGESVLDRRDTPVTPDVNRCGPRVGDFRIPNDALPGTYEIRRWVDIDGPTSWVRRFWPLQIQIEPLVIQVVTTVFTTPPADALKQ